MAQRTRALTADKAPELDEAARFEAWLKDFDARHADLTVRLDAVLRSLGVDPARVSQRETV
jgi:hypothetical protein